MKHPFRAAALAASALLCFSASQAFAGLELVGYEEGGSWFLGYRIDMTATSTQFDKIEVSINNGLTMVFPSVTIGTTGAVATSSNFSPSVNGFEDSGSRTFWSGPYGSSTDEPSWAQQGLNSSTHAIAAGNALDDLTFWVHLGTSTPNQNPSHGTRFLLDLYLNNAQVAHGQVWFKAANTGIGTDSLTSLSLVPVPAALWTGLPMLGGMILLIRRKKSRVLS